jgi:hypothetical protein
MDARIKASRPWTLARGKFYHFVSLAQLYTCQVVQLTTTSTRRAARQTWPGGDPDCLRLLEDGVLRGREPGELGGVLGGLCSTGAGGRGGRNTRGMYVRMLSLVCAAVSEGNGGWR